ncbi:2-oxoacid:acceptor oxidoreductase family protein [Oceanirhabdus sp. W0125-5]|uniref:2-oxoacid:acceptor oxidoreductase family protein n=1 Tax=Oceanirhabdus sp. W0125-5 TaxID=2999116 RepID=UPI0022F3071F|nr:2-oxoacid:acceptor oxidoreductase family protein [Oceanirhabdus sp. W0125-5]WBW98062.1 2-oxoacid:acceptor oxidoreductase family protein [Oceanirhabdus sp. W0125-5]
MASQEIIFAGFGGQGILSMGKFLSYAGMDEGLNVSWCPSYGPEMRGGTANCSVIVTDDQIGSPIVNNPTSIVVMNRPSLDKFEHMVEKGGLIIVDSDLVDREVERDDVEVIKIPAQTVAKEIGSQKIANMVLLGAFVEKTGIIKMESLIEALGSKGKEAFFEVNKQALAKGAEFVK